MCLGPRVEGLRFGVSRACFTEYLGSHKVRGPDFSMLLNPKPAKARGWGISGSGVKKTEACRSGAGLAMNVTYLSRVH